MTSLMLMVLIPGAGMMIIAGAAGAHSWEERRLAASISSMATHMDEVMTARAAIRAENVSALALASAAEYGLKPDALGVLYGVDFRSRLATARAAVDANRFLQAEPSLRRELRAVMADRPGIDDGTVTAIEAMYTFDGIIRTISDRWMATEESLNATLAHGSIAGELRELVDALNESYEAFAAGDRRIAFAVELATGAPGASVHDLITADAELAAATGAFEGRLGPRGAAAYRRFQADPLTGRFETVVKTLIRDGLAGRTSPLAEDPVAFGAAFVDSAGWVDGSTRVVAAASADVGAVARRDATAQSRRFWVIVSVAALVFVLAMVAAAACSRWFTRPLKRIASVVQAVREGAFDIPRVEPHGPRELAVTVSAINDMAASIDESSHDLTSGLLNRRAAMDAVARGLARARRNGRRYVALYLDLDGLKQINDVHGHQTGDRAISAVGTALRRTCRSSDVIARVGGDEFLVAGEVGDDIDAFSAQADRIVEAIGSHVLWCGDMPTTLSCSVGVAMGAPGSLDVEALMADADAAMYAMRVARRGPTGLSAGSR